MGELVTADEARRLREDATAGPWATSKITSRSTGEETATILRGNDRWVAVLLPNQPNAADLALAAAAPSLALTVEVQAWRIAELEAERDAAEADLWEIRMMAERWTVDEDAAGFANRLIYTARRRGINHKRRADAAWAAAEDAAGARR